MEIKARTTKIVALDRLVCTHSTPLHIAIHKEQVYQNTQRTKT